MTMVCWTMMDDDHGVLDCDHGVSDYNHGVLSGWFR